MGAKSKGGDLVYRCRNCNAEVKDTHAPSSDYFNVAMESDATRRRALGAALGLPSHDVAQLGPVSSHVFCPDGRHGVTDLIAFAPDKPE